MNYTIATAAEEQSVVNEGIKSNTAEIVAAAEQISVVGKKTADSHRRLLSMVVELDELISRFNLKTNT
tara:strand:+ start:221 stop:424 length:204 start_codon:yes stop_codon:yes gene_type:complete